jgi:hypothetical protein
MARCLTKKPFFARAAAQSASKAGYTLARTLEFQFRRRYNLPPTDPRFLDATYEDILLDDRAHYFAQNPNAQAETFFTSDFEAEMAKFLAEEDETLEEVPEAEPEARSNGDAP